MLYSDQSRISLNSDSDNDGDIIRVEDYNESSNDQEATLSQQGVRKKISFTIDNILGINCDNDSEKSIDAEQMKISE